ncbi:MAG: glycosyltransferase [Sulfurimonas sp.]|jgi:hypothetical protein|uniref:glycosyltransferase n=1 Tax=Sulfurimonas sp. TaxID=2022749 RepID=UPI002A3D8130|nr:glycosyltransferase [Dehalococcoidales bacterium]
MISVILNMYRRPYNLKKQLDAVKAQSVTVRPENIHVWYNNGDIPQNYPEDREIKTYTCSWNTKFWGRFLPALLCRTEYVAVFDDDVFPAEDWLRNCLDTIQRPETCGILGGSGILLPGKKGYRPHRKVGWNGLHSDKAEEVDLVGHAWFFRKEWAKYMWMEPPVTWDNGEDILFSYLAQKYGGIKTFVPPHPENNRKLWCTDENMSTVSGSDAAASFIGNTGHYGERDRCVDECRKNGWRIKGGGGHV